MEWHTKKFLDFKDWCIIAKLQFFGYHLLPEGKHLINLIKTRMNNYRLSTNLKYNTDIIISESQINDIFSLPAPYTDHGKFRTRTGTFNLVPQSEFKFNVIDLNNKTITYSSIKKCSKNLKIKNETIVRCLIDKTTYNGYTFLV